MMKPLLTLALVLAGAAPALAGPIDSACLQAGRDSASRALCTCIQQVADSTLSRADQRRAAAFFKDPEKAQQVRLSDRAADEDFWARYKGFAEAAEAYCAP